MLVQVAWQFSAMAHPHPGLPATRMPCNHPPALAVDTPTTTATRTHAYAYMYTHTSTFPQPHEDLPTVTPSPSLSPTPTPTPPLHPLPQPPTPAATSTPAPTPLHGAWFSNICTRSWLVPESEPPEIWRCCDNPSLARTLCPCRVVVCPQLRRLRLLVSLVVVFDSQTEQCCSLAFPRR